MYTKTAVQKGRYTRSDITADRLLTNISVGHFQDQMEDFIHDVFPIVPVNEETGRYQQFTKDDLLRIDAKARKPGADFDRKTIGASQPTYTCEQYALEIQLPDEDRSTADSQLDDATMTRILSQDLMLKREYEFMQAYLAPTSGVWGSYKNGGGADFTQWNASSGVTIIANLRDWISEVKTNSGLKPNFVAMTQDVWDVVQDDSDVLARIDGMGSNRDPARTTKENFAAIIGVDEVKVASAVYNTAAEGLTYSGAFVQTERVLVGYRAPTPSKLVPSAGYIFSWTPFDQVSKESGLGANIERYREDRTRSDIFRGSLYFDPKVVAASAGLLAYDVLA